MTAPELPRTAEYTLRHVWSTGTDADTSAYDDVHYQTPPGVIIDGIGRSQIRAFGPPNTPILEDVLPNNDGLYSPGGLLGGFVGRGPTTTFEAQYGVDVLGDAADVPGDTPDVLGDGGFSQRRFVGNITTAPQAIDESRAPAVQVRSLGTIRKLALVRPIIPLHENILTGAAFSLVADACGWDVSARKLSDGNTTLLWFWGDGNTDGVTLLNAIAAAEGVPSCWYVDDLDGDGVLHFEDRLYRQNTARSNTVQWTFFDGPQGSGNPSGDDPATLGDSPNTFGDGPLAHPLFFIVPAQWTSNPDEVVDRVTATINVRTPTPTGGVMKIWEYGGPLALDPFEVLDIPIAPSDPFRNAVVPVSGTDYTVAGGGSVTSVTLTQTSGQATVLRFVAGPIGATVIGVTSNGPQLRAQSLPITTSTPVRSTANVSLSSARFEPKPYAIPLWAEVSFNQALDLANSFVRRYQRPREQMVIEVANLDGHHMFAILKIRISDRIRIVHTHGVINYQFFVETMRDDLSSGGGLHILTLGCERVTDDIPSRYGSARYGFNTYND